MPCYFPMLAYRSATVSKTGKRPLVFNPSKGYSDMSIKLPCGQCIGCKLDHSRNWAIRCVHEAQLHDKNCFITLTYNNENLPADGSVSKRHLQLFMKRLRRRFENANIKFYGVGEYGDKMQRPHYHVCLFGFDFEDKKIMVVAGQHYYKNKFSSTAPCTLYRSADLEKLWPFGFSSIGEVTMESAGYVARYVQKKQNGDHAKVRYGEKEKEFALMSRGGKNGHGIGYDWYKKYKTDLYPKDFCTLKGRKYSVPKYYDKLLEKDDEILFKTLKMKRQKDAEKRDKGGMDRFRRFKYKNKQVEKLIRSYENE